MSRPAREARRIVVVGGYGHFGRLIAPTLARDAAFEVVIAGRDLARASKRAREIGCKPASIDIAAADLDARIAGQDPWLVLSAAGPFQGRDYRLARAAIACGAHYIDIADAREYVCGIAALDAEARSRDVLVASGASSTPALSSAVVDHYRPRFTRLDEIDVGISGAALPGRATVAAVLGYCGRPIPAWRGSAADVAVGGRGLRRHRFARPPMSRWLFDCDVPDLELLPQRHPELRRVGFGGGVELAAAQWTVSALARLVEAGLVSKPERISGLLARAAPAFARLATGRSAMFVRMAGIGHDRAAVRHTWELRARNDEGQYVPCMAAVALARKLAGGFERRGATACVGLVTLEEYLHELRHLEVEAHEVD